MGSLQDTKHAPCGPITVDSGLLSGLQLPDGSTRAFLGIPYAAPPVEDLRWRPPQRPRTWAGVRSAETFGPSSIQFPPPATSLYHGRETEFSEDCLYLNIWTGPAGAKDRPVLVWFHFGAFQFGSGANPMYNGTKLAAEGITVVTVNYRLGRLGFLAHSELTAESDFQTSGNYGIMDQIASLEWVQRNIEAFGGGPGNVTIGGASAGGGSVHILRSSPLARGLFSKAICESGPGVAPTVDGPGHVAALTTLAAAETAGAELLDHLGVSSIEELRKIPTQKILTAHLSRTDGLWKTNLWPGSISLSIFDTATPIVDGHVLPESPLVALLSGRAADVPLMAGNVADEATGLPYLDSLDNYRSYMTETFGEHAAEALQLYPATTDAEVRAATLDLLADQVFVWPTWSSARLRAKNLKSPAWYYRFVRAPPIPSDSNVVEREYAGAFHVAGVPYAFGNLDIWQWDWTEDDRTLSRDFFNALVLFLRTGNPSGTQGQPDSWPALKSTGDASSIKVWDVTSRLEMPGPRASEVAAFWNKHYRIEEHTASV